MTITIHSTTETPIFYVPVTDNLTGMKAVFPCRLPTTEEKTGYMNECIVRKGKRTDMQIPKARAKYAGLVLLGVRQGDWEIPVSAHPNASKLGLDDGVTHAPMSSDPDSPAYVPTWKKIVFHAAPHMMDALAAKLFDDPAEAGDIMYEDDAEKN